jgi:hypothetical protein
MPTLEAFRNAVEDLNRKFPRPELVLITGEPWDLCTQFATHFPDSESPGIYALIAGNGIDVLRIGKAQCLGYRLGAYFKRADGQRERGIAKHPGYKNARYVVTVPLPIGRAFEAPSVEEFLLGQFRWDPPSLNKILGRFED